SVGGNGKTQMAGRTFADRSSLVAQALTRQPRVKRTASIKPGFASKEAGLVLDYQTIGTGSNNFTFAADQTYYISSSASFSGTTTFEGGAIIKLAPYPSSSATIILNGPSVWSGGPFRPTVLTARDDNTCGDAISGSSGSPINYYGSYTLQPSDT